MKKKTGVKIDKPIYLGLSRYEICKTGFSMIILHQDMVIKLIYVIQIQVA